VPPAPGVRPRTPKGRAREAHRRLAEEYPEAICALDHRNPFELLAATILSAQTTDERVNLVTPHLFARYPTPADLAAADPAELEEIVRSTGFYKNKSRSLMGMAAALVERFDGEVPGRMADLTSLPGVGRKTANVVRSVALGLPGLPVDTHVGRLSLRLGLTVETDPVKVEHELNPMVPAGERGEFSLRLILHGRAVCDARRPACDRCVLADFCPSAGFLGPASASKPSRTARRRPPAVKAMEATEVFAEQAAGPAPRAATQRDLSKRKKKPPPDGGAA
jgi:endonuclease III